MPLSLMVKVWLRWQHLPERKSIYLTCRVNRTTRCYSRASVLPNLQRWTHNADGTTTFETAWNNGFTPPVGGTIRLYGSWQGIAPAGGMITLPSIYMVD